MKKEEYKNFEFTFDEEIGVTICQMKYDNTYFYGDAQCAKEDMDMVNKKTGEEIAFNRAYIEVMRHERDILKTELRALNSLYYSIKHSKKYNPKSYEACMLRRQIRMREGDIALLKEDIKMTKEYIKRYIDEKDKFYKEMRNIRKKKQLEEEHAKDNEN